MNDGLKAFGFYEENYIIEAEEREVSIIIYRHQKKQSNFLETFPHAIILEQIWQEGIKSSLQHDKCCTR